MINPDRPRINEALYKYAEDLLDELQIMPCYEQQAEHLARALKHITDSIIKMTYEDITEMLQNGLF